MTITSTRSVTVIDTERIPIKVWAKPEDMVGFDSAIQQAKNLANHQLTQKWVGLMPDFHVGYGMPIGGVIATQGGVIPNAVGVDIGCGMIATRLNVYAQDITDDVRNRWRVEAHARIPVGNGPGGVHQTARALPQELLARLSLVNRTEETAEQYPVIRSFFTRAAFQLGTLGGGNHFVELQYDQDGMIWLMVHSGSRNIGKQVCDFYHAKAKRLMQMFHVPLPDMDLAFLPSDIPAYTRYMEEMRWCMDYAEKSRRIMMESAVQAFCAAIGGSVLGTKIVATHHNFAALEHHFGQDYLIHRKGAVKAEGLVTIPGSMGTASYICQGLKPVESFNTCSHGAGRVLGRGQANRTLVHEEVVESMRGVAYDVKPGEYDEAPGAYKNIDNVIAAQRDLVDPVYHLKPLAVIKG